VGKGTGSAWLPRFGIVQQHNGWIEVESEVGRGTTFHLYMPRTVAEPAVLQKAAPAASPGGKGELILLVEDEMAVQEVGRMVLSRNGYEC